MKKVYATLILLFFVIGMIPVINAQENLSLISPQKQIVAIEGQEKVELKSNQVLTVANRSVVAIEQNVINIERTSEPVLLKPTEDFVSIDNTSLDIKQMEEPLISVEIETPELTNKVEIKKEAQELSITTDNVTTFTTNELEIKDAKLYLVRDEKALEIKVLPVVVSERVKRIEPRN
ncbi:MAG: hypothetical protein U9O85_03535 [Euryarchaeota archaeon]|nr:hypothetical protein [Euryarchaeota archaeon]